MSKFLGMLKNKWNVHLIESSQKKGDSPTLTYKNKNVPLAIYAVYSGKQVENPMTPALAARYYTELILSGHSDALKPFYLLTMQGQRNGAAIREKYDVVQNSDAVNAYRSESGRKKYSKTYNAAAAAILANIQLAAKGKKIVGYTIDGELAEKFLMDCPSEKITDGELAYIWRNVPAEINPAGDFRPVRARRDILCRVFPEYKRMIPIKAQCWVEASDDPFNTTIWRAIKHQLALGKPLDETVFVALEKFSQLREVLDNGRKLNGLNLENQIQIGIIQKAMVLDENEGGSTYIDELQTEHGWLSEDEMVEVYRRNEQLMREAKMTSKMKRESHEAARQEEIAKEKFRAEREQKEMLEFQKAQHEAQLKAQQAQINAQKATARATLDAQIAQLKVQAEQAFQRGTSPAAPAYEKSQAMLEQQHIEQQIRELEREKGKLY